MSATLPAQVLSACFLELSLTLKAGISMEEAVGLLAKDSRVLRVREALTAAAGSLEQGLPVSRAFEACGVFPEEAVQMLRVGEQTGRLEAVCRALSEEYLRRDRLSQSLRSAVLYPSVLLALTLAVIVLLVTRVVPVFADIYAQLGASMSGFASWLLRLGQWLTAFRWWLLGALGLLVAAAAGALSLPSLRAKLAEASLSTPSLRQATERAHLSSVLAMTLASGLNVEQGLELAASLPGRRQTVCRLKQCRDRLEQGVSPAEVFAAGGVLSETSSQLLAVGLRTGTVDEVASEIARRAQEELEAQTEASLSRIEPLLTVLMCLCVGAVLLSVMLPLLELLTVL